MLGTLIYPGDHRYWEVWTAPGAPETEDEDEREGKHEDDDDCDATTAVDDHD